MKTRFVEVKDAMGMTSSIKRINSFGEVEVMIGAVCIGKKHYEREVRITGAEIGKKDAVFELTPVGEGRKTSARMTSLLNSYEGPAIKVTPIATSPIPPPASVQIPEFTGFTAFQKSVDDLSKRIDSMYEMLSKTYCRQESLNNLPKNQSNPGDIRRALSGDRAGREFEVLRMEEPGRARVRYLDTKEEVSELLRFSVLIRASNGVSHP